jgi:hypothetical protein
MLAREVEMESLLLPIWKSMWLAQTSNLRASAGGFTNATSTVFSVSASAAGRLTIATQPSAIATAGVAFAQQPVVRIEDQFGNLMSSDNSTVVIVSRGLGTATLQGTVSRTAINGVVTFTDLSYNVAETINLALQQREFDWNCFEQCCGQRRSGESAHHSIPAGGRAAQLE